MANKKYEVPEAGSDAYLTYSVQDAPDLSYEAWLHSRGKSYTWLRRNRLANDPGYTHWKQRMTQNYQNYLDSYNQNYNSEASRRLRLENTGFSGQYLANGIGGSSSAPISLNPQFGSEETQPGTKANKGLEKVMESLQLMSNAGIAMKNYGEGKAAMKYADEMGFERLYGLKNKNKLDRYEITKLSMQDLPERYGYKYDNESKRWVYYGDTEEYLNASFNSSHTPQPRSPWLENYLNNINIQKAKDILYVDQHVLNSLTEENRRKYEAATMEAQKGLVEAKKSAQEIENEYIAALKQMGLAMPIIQMLVKTFLH